MSKQNAFRDWLLDWSYCLPERAMSELESIFGDYIVPASAQETCEDCNRVGPHDIRCPQYSGETTP